MSCTRVMFIKLVGIDINSDLDCVLKLDLHYMFVQHLNLGWMFVSRVSDRAHPPNLSRTWLLSVVFVSGASI